jgi:glucosamine--fructose-6-phosphate aminotransferase (isomerizing)
VNVVAETLGGSAGSLLLGEIREQPRVLERLLERTADIEAVAAEAVRRGTSIVRMVGHGSSDNAASFGVYAFGLLPAWTALRDSISLSVYYGAEVDLRSSAVIALSQSGRTPDVVEYVERARRRGAYTIALTNDETSPLAVAAEAVVPLGAGEERAIAATKTYTAELAALSLLAAHAAGQGAAYVDGVRTTAALQAELIERLGPGMSALATALAFIGRMFVVGRGPEFATAREISLKLLETCRVAAEPLTATDLAHGPVAALDAMFPVWMIAAGDASLPAVLDAARRVRAGGGTILASGPAAAELEGAAAVLDVPPPPLPLLGPLLSIVPGQVFAWALAKAKGLDPDRPNGLAKVTLAP